jgi:hypothetical protein
MMKIHEYYLSLRHLIQADLVFLDRVGDYVVTPALFEVVIPEVSDRESMSLSSGSLTKPPLCEVSVEVNIRSSFYKVYNIF